MKGMRILIFSFTQLIYGLYMYYQVFLKWTVKDKNELKYKRPNN